MNSIKGIIFDLDGTMVNNMMVHHRAWQKILGSLGLQLTLPEVKERVHGVNEEILERLFGNRFTAEEGRQIALNKEVEYRRIFIDQLSLIDGLDQFFKQIESYPLPKALATAAPKENVDFVLDNLKLRSRFKSVIHAGHVTEGKPNPQALELASAGLGLKTRECLIFEDSPTGAETALRAGSPAVIITTTHTKQEFDQYPNVKAFIDNYTDLDLNYLIKLVSRST